MIKIAVLVSGGGTNLQALIDAQKAGAFPNGEIALVMASNQKAYALERAKNAGIESVVVSRKSFVDPADYDRAVVETLQSRGIELVVLAGFLSILGKPVIEAYPERILNIHPSLIPSFCGAGFYGLRVHQAALDYGVKVTGATVHLVNEIPDGGRILLQKAVEVLPGDTPKPTATPTPPPFAITVDVNNQVTIVYGRDENGDYTVVIREMLCSTGTKKNPSDVGDWVLSGRTARWCYFPTWGSYAQYWTKINASIAFHSVIYNSVSTMDLAVSSYNNLGKRASHGCIRLSVADAKWVYDNCGKGTVVTITEDLPSDPELVASLKMPPLNKKNMLPQETPAPTPEPIYQSGSTPPLPLSKLSKGDSSEAVYWLQKKLTELGYYHGKCSGTYLAGTQAAVKAFQKDNGLSASGKADVKTLERLYAQELATPTPAPTAEPMETIAPLPNPGT